jgi:hypothetical protein
VGVRKRAPAGAKEASYADPAAIGVYLTRLGPGFTDWPEEEQSRRALATHGCTLVVPLLETAAARLAGFVPGLQSPLSAHSSNLGVNIVVDRAERLLLELIPVAPLPLSRELAGALGHSSVDVRLLAALFCGLRGLREDVVAPAIATVFSGDDEVRVRYAAATALAGMAKAPVELRHQAWRKLVAYAEHVRAEPDPAEVTPLVSALLVRTIGLRDEQGGRHGGC